MIKKRLVSPAFQTFMMWHHPILRALLITALQVPYIPAIPDCLLFLENAVYFLAFYSFLRVVPFDKNVYLPPNSTPVSPPPLPFLHWCDSYSSFKASLCCSKVSFSVKFSLRYSQSELVGASSAVPWLIQCSKAYLILPCIVVTCLLAYLTH